MNVRELTEILKNCDPEAEVMTGTSKYIIQNAQCDLYLPAWNAEEGTFPNVDANGQHRGKKFVVICSTTVWGISPRPR
jgi:hypothetical protein